MKLKPLLALTMALLSLLLFSACSSQPPASSEPEAEDSESVVDPDFPVEVGGVRLKSAPDKVVSLSPGLTEIFTDLGFSDRLAGVSDYCADAPEGAPRLGTIALPRLDELVDLRPDVVVSVSPLTGADRDALEAKGIKIAVLERARTAEDLERLYCEAARLMEGEEAGLATGTALYEKQLARLGAPRAAAQALGDANELCYLRVFPLTVATGDTFEHSILEVAGFTGSGAAYTDWSYPDEKKVELMPDVIVYDQAVGKETLSASDIYNTTPAYQNARCFALDLDAFERQGSRMFAQLEELALLLAPPAQTP